MNSNSGLSVEQRPWAARQLSTALGRPDRSCPHYSTESIRFPFRFIPSWFYARFNTRYRKRVRIWNNHKQRHYFGDFIATAAPARSLAPAALVSARASSAETACTRSRHKCRSRISFVTRWFYPKGSLESASARRGAARSACHVLDPHMLWSVSALERPATSYTPKIGGSHQRRSSSFPGVA